MNEKFDRPITRNPHNARNSTYQSSIIIYTNEMSMIHRNTNQNEYFPIMRIPFGN
jgi:hypothetical protein